jgi:hypothetical protein
MKVTLQGDETLQADALAALKAAEINVDLSTSKGGDGQQIVSFIIENGPQILALLNTIAQIVKVSIEKKKRAKVTIDTE